MTALREQDIGPALECVPRNHLLELFSHNFPTDGQRATDPSSTNVPPRSNSSFTAPATCVFY